MRTNLPRRTCSPLGPYSAPVAIVALGIAVGCLSSRKANEQVVVYAALDREFSGPVLDDFARQSGILVLPKYDIESTKSVGLASAIVAEASHPRCDVFWNNEILNTLRLADQGRLDVYQSPAAAGFPAMYRAKNGAWHGFAARGRVLVVNTNLVPPEDRPRSIYDLADARWKGKVGIARPVAGTTATHVACLFAVLGPDKAKQLLRNMRVNDIRIYGGNKQVAVAASTGEIAFGLTDTDDAVGEVERAAPVTIVYPDRGADELGTLFIPNTVSIVKGCPNPAAARRLVDFLLSPAVEAQLARGASAQIPLNPEVEAKLRVETPRTVKAMPIDFAAAAGKWDAAAEFIEEEFLK
ncbi:MAG TPA: extracellular solute-binding protein [Pirellulaceae bacterium]|nr:extracellular solute-binding protein [Pirellulaceae bacterium]